MATGKRLAREQASEKIQQIVDKQGDQRNDVIHGVAQWMDSLPRSRREAALDVFIEHKEQDDTILSELLVDILALQHEDLIHITQKGDDPNWPRMRANGGLHAVWHTLCVRNVPLVGNERTEKLRDLVAATMGLGGPLLATEQTSARKLGVAASELSDLWQWTAKQWSTTPVVLLSPIRSMVKSGGALARMEALPQEALHGLDDRFLHALNDAAGRHGHEPEDLYQEAMNSLLQGLGNENPRSKFRLTGRN